MAKPTERIPLWADAGTKIDPGGAKESAGWLTSERPPAAWINWIYNTFGQWLSWTEQTVDEQVPNAICQVNVNAGVAATNPGAIGIFAVTRIGDEIFVAPTGGIADSEELIVHVTVNAVSGGIAAIPYALLVNGQEGSGVVRIKFFNAAGSIIDLSTNNVTFAFSATGLYK